MTVAADVLRVFATGNDVTTEFSFGFKFFNSTEVQVYFDGVLQTTGYTVTADPDSDGGTVTFDTAPASGVAILFTRLLNLTQETRIPSVDRLPHGTLENTADKGVMLTQQAQEIIDRALKIPATVEDFDPTVPDTIPARRAFLTNDAGDGIEFSDYDPDELRADAEAFADAAEASAVASAASAAASASSATDADASADAAQASALAAAASAASLTYASVTEALTGTEAAKAMSPDTTAALWEQGADIASAATLAIPATGGGYFFVTGTTTITRIDQATAPKTGRKVEVKFAGALTLTHNSNILLPSSASITTAAGDVAEFRCEDTTTSNQIWRCVKYMKADGTAVAGSLPTAAQGAGLVLLSSTTVTAQSSVTVTGLSSTYDDYTIDLYDVQQSVDDEMLNVYVSQDGGSTWKNSASNYAWTAMTFTGGTSAGFQSTGDTRVPAVHTTATGRMGTGANETGHVSIRVRTPANSSKGKLIEIASQYRDSSGAMRHVLVYGQYIADANAINAIKIEPASGTISAKVQVRAKKAS